MLVDYTVIFVRSGKGGQGCVSFRREKYVPKGGPDGGDGGRGGDVVLVGDDSLDTLLHLTRRPHYRAESGKQGMGKQMHGADGAHCIVPVPLGTIIRDRDTAELIAEIKTNGERVMVAPGGRGGFGNEHFKSATHQVPREFTPGEDWVERTIELELKLIADVGLVGLPNAGKSTMLRAVSRATPRVADYPFTTLHPSLGIAELEGDRRLVIADIPGLIEGAAEGAGLGHDFLKHIERTRVLLHLVDVCPIDGSDPVQNHRVIRQELEAYSPVLAAKTEVTVLNKVDLLPDEEREETIASIREGIGVADAVCTSGIGRAGVREMLEACWRQLDKCPGERWSVVD